VEFRQPDHIQSGPKQRENDFTKGRLHLADRSRAYRATIVRWKMAT
jgi:hypothetical protein